MEVKMKQILQVVCLGFLLVVFLQGKELLCALFLKTSLTEFQENCLVACG